MDTTNKQTVLHPHFFDMLFAYKSNVGNVYRDVLGLYEIDHISISYINDHHELLTLSSTPALEFNLFHTPLWHHDQTYQHQWYSLCTQASWSALYSPEHHHDLYQLKQVKPHYPLGFSFARKLADSYVIYSIASHKDDLLTRELFAQQQDDFLKIGQYCSNALLPLITTS